ncbi:MAG: 8-oxo-dGTP diphosphatase [Pelotomaculum sp. PtaU1.Bin065]|nr:MAG: 8-oxo-dGTP diphosphatase [Pelotomaculum sp. PtaU1.Bin065]
MLREKLFTLCIITNENRVLLQLRKKPPFAGKWNAPGGKVEVNEDLYQACIREVYEETGIILISPNLVSIVDFENTDVLTRIYVFHAEEYSGVPIQYSEEGKLEWFPINNLDKHKTDFAIGLDWLINLANKKTNKVIEMVF